MRTLLLAALLAFFAAPLHAQQRGGAAGPAEPIETAGPSIVSYLEVFGSAIFVGSLNVEYPFTSNLAVRGGVSPIGAFPVMARLMTSGGPHRLEASAGVLAGHGTPSRAISMGYRYQPAGEGLVFRATVDPLLFWGGLSFGYAF